MKFAPLLSLPSKVELVVRRLIVAVLIAVVVASPADAARRRCWGSGTCSDPNCTMCWIIRTFGRDMWNRHRYNAPAVARQMAQRRQRGGEGSYPDAPPRGSPTSPVKPFAGSGVPESYASKYAAAEAGRTPHDAIEQMLEIARIGPGSVVIVPGSGDDARLEIACARAGARKVIGYEIDPGRAQQARKAVARAGFSDVIQIWQFDATRTDPASWAKADAVLTFLFDDVLEALGSHFAEVDRVVSYNHWVPGSVQYPGPRTSSIFARVRR